jgi:hypothetical protein
MVSAPSPPPAPDPYKTAQYQAELNRDAAISQQGLNMVNQVTPYGTLQYAAKPNTYQGPGNALHLRIGLQKIFGLGLVQPPDAVERHLHQSEITFAVRDVALDRLDQRVDGRLIFEPGESERLICRQQARLFCRSYLPPGRAYLTRSFNRSLRGLEIGSVDQNARGSKICTGGN